MACSWCLLCNSIMFIYLSHNSLPGVCGLHMFTHLSFYIHVIYMWQLHNLILSNFTDTWWVCRMWRQVSLQNFDSQCCRIKCLHDGLLRMCITLFIYKPCGSFCTFMKANGVFFAPFCYNFNRFILKVINLTHDLNI